MIPKQLSLSRTGRVLGLLLCSDFLWPAHAAAGEISFEGLGQIPGGNSSTYCSDVSADGSVVVGYGLAAGGFGSESYRWTRQDGYQLLGHLPGGNPGTVKAAAVSADGRHVVGLDARASGLPIQAFRWTEGIGMFGLGDLPGGEFFSYANDASADGAVVVGRGRSTAFPNGEAFRWTPQTGMVGMGDLPGGQTYSSALGVSADGRVIVGEGRSVGGDEAFCWTTEAGMVGLGWLPGGQTSTALAISSNGRVIVGKSGSLQGEQAFLWTLETGLFGLGDLPGSQFGSQANAVSADGAVVVGTSLMAVEPGLSPNEPFVWDAQYGMRSLRAILMEAGIDLTGWDLEHATGVSADGRTIVGTVRRPNGTYEPFLAHVPEPGTLALLLCAGALLRGRR